MMLKMLRDTDVHKVYTAVCLMKPMEEAKDPGYDMETCVEETVVKFDDTGGLICQRYVAIDGDKGPGSLGQKLPEFFLAGRMVTVSETKLTAS